MSLSIQDLYKSFNSPSGTPIDVLRGVSLQAEGGQMIAITGASGAGKSTLLYLIGGLEIADAGRIVFDMFEVTSAAASALARYRAKRLGFVFQFHHLLPDLTAVENVAMPLLINRWSQSKSIASARERLKEVGIADRSDHPAGHLSGGEQQRAALARAMVAEPRVLLADEPTGNLDASNTLEIGAMLKNYSRTRQALVIVATHNEQLAAFCDRRYLLQQGSLLELAF